jgi:hypothetical protein
MRVSYLTCFSSLSLPFAGVVMMLVAIAVFFHFLSFCYSSTFGPFFLM